MPCGTEIIQNDTHVTFRNRLATPFRLPENDPYNLIVGGEGADGMANVFMTDAGEGALMNIPLMTVGEA